MVERMKKHWQEFKQSKPGHRFQDRYHRQQRHERGHIVWRVFVIVLGAVIAVGSLVLAPLPGPGWITVFVGLMILAGEFLPAARFLDWLEVLLRKLLRFTRKIWERSILGKLAVVVVAATLAAAIVYVVYLVLSSISLF